MIMMGGDRKRTMNQILGDDPREVKEAPSEGEALHHCVSELMEAIHSKDIEAAVEALKSCFAELGQAPHEEG